MDYSTYFFEQKRNDGLHWKRNSGGNACGVDLYQSVYGMVTVFIFIPLCIQREKKETAGTAKRDTSFAVPRCNAECCGSTSGGIFHGECNGGRAKKEMTELYGQDGYLSENCIRSIRRLE